MHNLLGGSTFYPFVSLQAGQLLPTANTTEHANWPPTGALRVYVCVCALPCLCECTGSLRVCEWVGGWMAGGDKTWLQCRFNEGKWQKKKKLLAFCDSSLAEMFPQWSFIKCSCCWCCNRCVYWHYLFLSIPKYTLSSQYFCDALQSRFTWINIP